MPTSMHEYASVYLPYFVDIGSRGSSAGADRDTICKYSSPTHVVPSLLLLCQQSSISVVVDPASKKVPTGGVGECKNGSQHSIHQRWPQGRAAAGFPPGVSGTRP